MSRTLAAVVLCGVGLLAAACRKERVPTSDASAMPDASEPTCSATLKDCDGRADNGCETRLGSVAHCGACNARCGEGEACFGGRCLPDGDLVMTDTHTCHRDARGRVWCWGGNERGELGDGTTLMRDRPVVVRGVDAVQVVARARLTCARTRAGDVVCWGGPPGVSGPPPPRDAQGRFTVDALRGVTDLAIAEGVFCGLRPEGTIHCLPSFPEVQKDAGPPPGPAIDDAVDLAATRYGLCAARRSGSVTCWDLSTSGEKAREKRRTRVDGVSDAIAITASGETTCALRADGKVSCWGGGIVTAHGHLRAVMVGGAHDFGTLGPMIDIAPVGWPQKEDCGLRANGETICWAPPFIEIAKGSPGGPLVFDAKPIPAPPAIRIASTGRDAAHCVLGRDGDVRCWGHLARGRLGVGRPPEQPTPRAVEGVTGVRDLVASDGRVCARTSLGITCWGGGKTPHAVTADGVDRLLSGLCASVRGELVCYEEPFERPLPASDVREPVQLANAQRGSHLLSLFVRTKAGAIHRVAWERANDATAKWTRTLSARVRGLASTTDLFASEKWTCVREDKKTVRCFEGAGDLDAEGQIVVKAVPVVVPDGLEQLQVGSGPGAPEICGVGEGKVGCFSDAHPLAWLDLERVRRFKTSVHRTSCALKEDGTLACWGTAAGMTGHGSLAGPGAPARVDGIDGIVDWAFAQSSFDGREAVYVWLRDGRLLAWGDNGSGPTRGQLGWVGPTTVDVPTTVPIER